MSHPLLLISLLSLCFAGLHAEKTPSRHVSRGQGWRVDQAKVTDPQRPRILLIGDSILHNYFGTVNDALEGKAYVDAWIEGYNQATEGLDRMVAEVLACGPYDIIHFNMGLHGLKKGYIPAGQFDPLTRKLVQALQKGAPHAKLIWASTTPLSSSEKHGTFDPEGNPIVLEHNRMAAQVMQDLKVPTDDLYAVGAAHLELQRPDGVHWGEEGATVLGKAVIQSLENTLASFKPEKHN